MSDEAKQAREACRCACGPTGLREQHEDACPWWRWTCDDCHGNGVCRGCGGDGARQVKLATGAELLAMFEELHIPAGTFDDYFRGEAEEEWENRAPTHLARVREALFRAVDAGICEPPIDDWRTWALALAESIPAPPKGPAQ